MTLSVLESEARRDGRPGSPCSELDTLPALSPHPTSFLGLTQLGPRPHPGAARAGVGGEGFRADLQASLGGSRCPAGRGARSPQLGGLPTSPGGMTAGSRVTRGDSALSLRPGRVAPCRGRRMAL